MRLHLLAAAVMAATALTGSAAQRQGGQRRRRRCFVTGKAAGRGADIESDCATVACRA
jgi:hypothetical protein